MEKNEYEELVRLEKEIEKLPERAQQAIYWIVDNIDFVIDMCKESEMTDEEIEKQMRITKEKEDYLSFFLLCITEMYKNKV
ncbi:MAG: hypothetical protein HFE77_08230 [Clostridiales bacterium]|nr:hypothetical protein [Clostridiales bacterium]